MRVIDLPKYDLKKEEIQKVDRAINKSKNKRGALIPILQEIQKKIGFLPIEAQKQVALGLNIPEKDVYGVVTFYSFFTMVPRGKINIRVCLGTACYVKGGKRIIDRIGRELGINPGETTSDRMYSLQANRCLGACGIAPIIVINDKVCQKVKPEKVMDLIYNFK
jgi:NADH-quinone oxidoreductase subunit E/NADP-reducing hydrogenase subunit HndA